MRTADTTTQQMARRSMRKDGWTAEEAAAGAQGDTTTAAMMARSMRKDGWDARSTGTQVTVTVDGTEVTVA